MNTHMQDTFGKDLVGKQCYKVFRSEKEPCAHCTNDRLLGPNGEPTGVVVWEDENPVTNRSYRNYDKAIKWVDGRFVRLQVATDITDLKQAEEEQKKLEAQLWQAQKMEALGTIAGGIAHNFNNILMAIQGNASLMLLNTDPTHPNYERLKSISRSVQSGSRLTGQLLGYARKGRYQVRTTNLNELVRETSDTFGMAKREIRVHRDLAEDLSMINADPAQIEQVLLNLYVNASDVMPRGGDLFLRTTNLTHKDMGDKPYDVKPGDYVLLTVRDTGTGMDKKTMERLFDPFFTTKGMGRGTGLGLASVYGIIKAHSGYIDVESKRGHGTTFSIYLPASEKKVIVERQKRAELLMGTGTVLLVDDEAMILDVEAQMLRTLGYKVLLARSGKEAIELYKANKDEVDMVILDMVIPDMGGGETYDKIKEINSNVKVLLSSGYSVSGHPREILGRGCDAFIQKPFDIKGLSQKISEILDTR
jgi:two-component system cell cycle sensor histidine kinase/response regulator CckA